MLPKGLIEIRTIEPSLLIQKIVLDGASTISTGNKFIFFKLIYINFIYCRGCVYIGSDRSSWMLNSLSRFFQNIKFLSEIKQFDLAVLLVVIFFNLNKKLTKKKFFYNFKIELLEAKSGCI